MRTKTLLISAALGLATGAVAMAQVYSVNAVGYVNVALKPGFNMVANPLNNQTDNKVSTLFPAPPDGSTIYKYTAAGYSDANLFLADLGGWTDPNMTVGPGEGFWFNNPGTADANVTFVGEVPQGHLVNSLRAGFTMVGSIVPQAGKVSTDLGYPAVDGDTIYTYVGGYTIYSFIADLGGWDPAEPTMAVAQGFWSLKTAAVDWTRDFSVNTP